MGLLAAVHYDPGTAVGKATTAAQVMTAIDTTNLRTTFTCPANGIVKVRQRCCLWGNGNSSMPTVLLGVLDGSTVRGRQAPIGGRSNTAVVSYHQGLEANYVVTGLTPGNSYSFDAAYGVETVDTAAQIRYGGPNDTTTNNAWGGFTQEIWTTNNLLAGKLYDPSTAVAKATSSLLAITAFDTTNLRHTFTAPVSGNVVVRMQFAGTGAATIPSILGAVLESSTVRGRAVPLGGTHDPSTPLATTHYVWEVFVPITGLTGGNSYTFDAAYGVDVVVASSNIEYGGPDDTTANNAWGGLAYEIWAA